MKTLLKIAIFFFLIMGGNVLAEEVTTQLSVQGMT